MPTVQWLPPGVVQVPGTTTYQPQYPGGIPTLNPDGTLTPNPSTPAPPAPPGNGGIQPTPLGDVPVEGEPSTTEGLSWSDALTYSTGSPLLDASAGAVAGYLVAPPAAKAAFVAAGALGAGLLGALGVLGVVAVGVAMRGRK
jgi:hypothetical protein